jgi:hypothetical protein
VSLVEFSKVPKTILPLTSDFRKFESALHNIGKWTVQRNQHHLYDSLFTALNLFPDRIQPSRRRCIIVLTMTTDGGSRHTADDVALAAKAKRAGIFVSLLSLSRSAPHPMPSGRGIHANGPAADVNREKMTLEPLVRPNGGDIRVYEVNQYAIAKAIRDTVNK